MVDEIAKGEDVLSEEELNPGTVEMCREVPWIEPEVPEAAVPGEGKEVMLDPDEEEQAATLWD